MGLGLSKPGDIRPPAAPQAISKGGLVYASDGTYVNYQPKGTDTVPAMLSPGEFVVNAKSTKNNLGLLRSINSSAGNGKTFSSGGVVYAAGGLASILGYGSWDNLAQAQDAADAAKVAQNTSGSSATKGLFSNRYFPTLGPIWDSIKKLFSSAGKFSIPNLGNLGKLDLTQLLRGGVRGLGRLGGNIGNTVMSDFAGASGNRQVLGGFRNALLSIIDEVGNFGLTEGGRAVRSATSPFVNMSGAMGYAARNTLAAPGNTRTLSQVGESLGKILGNTKGAGVLFRYLGPLIGVVEGFMADTDQTKRGRLTNTILGAATGSGTTMRGLS